MPEVKTELMTGDLTNGTSNSGITTDRATYTVSEVLNEVMKTLGCCSLCTCNARVICTNATEDSAPRFIQIEDGRIHIGKAEELNRTNIAISRNFEGCEMASDGKCHIAEMYEEWIADKEWKEVDESSSQGEEKENLNEDTSYMVCVEHGGIIYFYDAGQELQPYINGEAILCLSNDYINWLKDAEGFKSYPHIVDEDNQDAKDARTVTLGYGFTFNGTDKKGLHWEILHEVLGWEDEEIEEIINEIYDNKKDYSEVSKYNIDPKQAEMLIRVAAERQYMPDLNAVIEEYHTKENQTTTYSQRELEAMFDYSYNPGLRVKEGGSLYDVFVNNEDRVIYYYLRKDQKGAVNAVKKWGSDDRRRLNQMNLFFNKDDADGYDFSDELDQFRNDLGFFDSEETE